MLEVYSTDEFWSWRFRGGLGEAESGERYDTREAAIAAVGEVCPGQPYRVVHERSATVVMNAEISG